MYHSFGNCLDMPALCVCVAKFRFTGWGAEQSFAAIGTNDWFGPKPKSEP